MNEDIEDAFIIKHTDDITDLFIKFKEISKSHGSTLFTNKQNSSYDLINFIFQYIHYKKENNNDNNNDNIDNSNSSNDNNNNDNVNNNNDNIDDNEYIIDQEYKKIYLIYN